MTRVADLKSTQDLSGAGLNVRWTPRLWEGGERGGGGGGGGGGD